MKTQSSDSPQVPPVDDTVNRFWNVAQDAALSTLDFYATWLGDVAKAQTELLQFVGERFTKNAQVLIQFAGCRSPADISRLQVSAGTGMVADYLAEMLRVFNMFAVESTEKSVAV